MIGETIGNFRVTAKLGAGGMGEVFVAEQRSIETKVAIKILRKEISLDRAHVDRFFNEARAVSKIKHAGTVKIFDVGFHDAHAYLVMEFLEGETLSARIRRTPMPLAQLCDIGKQTCGVLEATHAAGITHRDLKPDNIFLIPDSELASGERVKILDFGIAKLTGATVAGKPQTVGTMGTPAYMAPEQWSDAGTVDARADVYSLGCVLFEMAAGRTPFLVESFAQACGAHLSQQPPKLRSIVPGSPVQLEALIDGMLAKAADHRPTLRDAIRVLGELGSLPHVAPISQAAQVAVTVAPDAPTYGVHVPTPVDQQTPNAPIAPTPHYPPNLVKGPGELVANTTLSSVASSAPTKPSRAPLFAIGGVIVVGIIIAIAVGRPGKDEPKQQVATTPDAAPPPPGDAAVVTLAPDAAPAAPKVWVKPEFVDLAGAKVMPRQATRADYAGYLNTLAPAAHLRALPLKAWSNDQPDEPVGWVTLEQAAAFCKAIDAALPTKQQWLALARGSWRIGTAVPGEIVFRDWTSTLSENLAVVLGGTTTMTDAERKRAVTSPLLKHPTRTETTTEEQLAAPMVGIRCMRGDVTKTGTGTGTGRVGGASVGDGEGATGGLGLGGLSPRPAGLCDGVDGLISQGDAAKSSGDYARALSLYEQAVKCRPAVTQKAFQMACRSHDFLKAKRLFTRLGSSLQQVLVTHCLNEGYDPRT